MSESLLSNQKLLPCPFCGGEAVIEEVRRDPSFDEIRWSVGCTDSEGKVKTDGYACVGYMSVMTYPRKKDAIEAWNMRAVTGETRAGITYSRACKLLADYAIALQDRQCCGDEMQPQYMAALKACTDAMGAFPEVSAETSNTAISERLSERLKSLMWSLGPSRYIEMRELIISAERLEMDRASACRFPGYCKCCGTEGARAPVKAAEPRELAPSEAASFEKAFAASPRRIAEPTPLTLRDFGYAPGNYTCICFSCGAEFVGDKRAIQCEPCASAKLARSLHPKTSGGTP